MTSASRGGVSHLASPLNLPLHLQISLPYPLCRKAEKAYGTRIFVKRKKRKLQYQWYHNFRSYLAGAEGLGLACRLGRCFCTSCRGLHRRPAPLGTLRVPSVQIIQSEPKQKDTRRCLFILAGAEGLEPSARGFGDRCSTN